MGDSHHHSVTIKSNDPQHRKSGVSQDNSSPHYQPVIAVKFQTVKRMLGALWYDRCTVSTQ